MNTVIFPSINLELNIKRVAFSIFGIDIYWYGIIIALAIMIALLILKLQDDKFEIEFNTILDLAIYLIPISLICARIYYVLFNLQQYTNNPLKIFNLRDGGMAIYGGIIGGLITCIIFCKKRKIKILNMLDYIVPVLALGQAIGRWGNFINIEAHGTETNSIFRMGIIENGTYMEVHPTFLYESIITFFLAILLLNIKDSEKIKKDSKKQLIRKYPGQVTFIYLIVYSFARFFIEGIRTDSLMLFNFRISQILSMAIFVVFCLILTYKELKHKKIY